MPEIGSEIDKKISIGLRSLPKTRFGLWPENAEIEELLERHGEKEIAHGGECVVVDRGQKVAAFTYEKMSPERRRTVFYTHRVLSTLFRHNFPRFFATASGEEISGSLRQTITGRELRDNEDSLRGVGAEFKSGMFGQPAYPFSEVVKKTQELGLPVTFEMYAYNFMLGDSDKGEYYLDTVELKSGKFSLDNIMSFMDEANAKAKSGNNPPVYSSVDRRVVKSSVEVLSQLLPSGETPPPPAE